MSECIGDGCDHSSHERGPVKTSRWSEAEREGALTPLADPPSADARPPLPSWIGTFVPGSTFEHEGWTCAVRHVGYEGGHWMMLVEPLSRKEPRSVSRSEFRRLRTQVGKKKAREILASRGQEVPVTQEELDAGSDD